MKHKTLTRFSEQYREEVFWIWYRSGRPSDRAFAEMTPEYNGDHPTARTIKDWRTLNLWNDRADDLDEQVARELEKRAIQERVEMLQRHAEIGMEMMKKGSEYLLDETTELDDVRDAIAMIRVGHEIEAKSRGLPDILFKIGEWSDQKVVSVIDRLYDKLPADSSLGDVMEMIEAEIIDSEEEDADEPDDS